MGSRYPTLEEIESTYQQALADGFVTPEEIAEGAARFIARLESSALRGIGPRKEQDSMERVVKVGDPIVFIDAQRERHAALATAVWSESCVNVVFVVADPARTDPYGRQLERHTSVVHASLNSARAMCWAYPDEEIPPPA